MVTLGKVKVTKSNDGKKVEPSKPDGKSPEVAILPNNHGESSKAQSQGKEDSTSPLRSKRQIPRKNYNDENDPGFLAVVEMEEQTKVMAKKLENEKRDFFNKMLQFFDEPEYLREFFPNKKQLNSSTVIGYNTKPYRRRVHLAAKICQKVISTILPGVPHETLVMDVIHSLNKVIYDSNEVRDYTKLKENYDRLTETICKCTRKTQKASIERRVCRAILHRAVPKTDMVQLLKKYDFTFGNGCPRKRARDDYQTLLEGKQLEKRIHPSKAPKETPMTDELDSKPIKTHAASSATAALATSTDDNTNGPSNVHASDTNVELDSGDEESIQEEPVPIQTFEDLLKTHVRFDMMVDDLI